MRIGWGYDVHRLTPSRSLILGGVNIPHHQGLQGHSDADVLIHAVCDALLGAAALGDLGRHFPDSDPRYKGISSLTLLARTGRMLAEQGFAIVNLDATVVAQAPRLAAFRDAMRRQIANALNLDMADVSVKFTTTEKLGPTGRQEGIAATAAVLVKQAHF